MHKGDTLPGIITTVFGFGVAAYTLIENTMRFRAQTSDGVPGAGFFPIILGFILGMLGVFLTIRGIRAKGKVQFFKIENEEVRKNVKMLLLTIAGIIAFFALWRITHIFIVWALALVVYLNFIFERKWKFNIIYSVVFIAFLYVTFVLGFSIQFNI